MSRNISATNLAEVNASHLSPVVMVKLEFDTPAYVHSSLGTITYDGNDYLGVGDLGDISSTRESEGLRPSPITISLSGVDSDNISEALDSGNYGDVITIYMGYLDADLSLVDDPWVLWKGWYEHASISQSEESVVTITCQHDLSVLDEKDGSRFSDESQQLTYAGDTGFQFVYLMATTRLLWGGKITQVDRADNNRAGPYL